MTAGQIPHVSWDWGTAYDLFASLHVLHHPENFGLRGSWAAGVRSRLTSPQRDILEDAQKLFFSSPLGWVASLPVPKDGDTALWALAKIPPGDRLPILARHFETPPEVVAILNEVHTRRAWNSADLEKLQRYAHPEEGKSETDAMVLSLNWWAHPEEFGERYLAAVQAYMAVFFAEEERRIKPYLQQALTRGQELAARLNFSELFIELSQGVSFPALEQADEVTFVPSYWTTPLVMYDRVIENHWVVLYGARPTDVALVPGEVVPDGLLRALKALSDPTRLLILRYLSDQPQTPSQLARKLRLRPPTVIHHLNTLRLAGLVYISLDMKEEKRYTVRVAALVDTFGVLNKFLMVKPGNRA